MHVNVATNVPDPPNGFASKGFAYGRTMLVLVIMLVCGAGTVLWHVSSLQSRLVETMALDHAALYSHTLKEVRTLYTSEVVSRVKKQGIEVTHDYKATEGAIPLPVTFSMLLGNRIAVRCDVGKMRIYSDYPFPWRGETGGLRDEFDVEAWKALSADQHTPYYRFEEVDGRRSLRYATADVMRKACINCHNSHPDTPKNDWKEGDLRGVLEVVSPLNTAIEQTEADLKGSFSLISGLVLFGFVALAMVLRKFRRVSIDLERRVEARTSELQESQNNIQGSYERLRTETREREKAQSAQLKMELQLRQAQKLESIGQLAAGIAHEINTPAQFTSNNIHFIDKAFSKILPLLGTYKEVLQGAREESLSEERLDMAEAELKKSKIDFLLKEIPKAIDQAGEGTKRIAGIVRAMKEFSHPGTHHKTSTNINRGIENTITVSRNEWKYAAEIITDLEPSLPMIACYPGELNQVILNLIVNAAQAIAERNGDVEKIRDTITIRTRQRDNCVEIEIADTGPGMPEEIVSRIFDPFFTTKEVGHGSGQGLAIAHSVIVEKHGGRIECVSQVGKGTTFRILLPIGEEQ